MDVTAIIGILLGLGLVLLGVVSTAGEGLHIGRVINFWSLQALLISLGGTAAALIIAFPSRTLLAVPRMIMKLIKPDNPDPREYIRDILDIAYASRKNGLLSLEAKTQECRDAFLKSGVMLIVDSAGPDMIRDVMEGELDAMAERHRQGQDFFEKAGSYAPGFGILGTLIGLINALARTDDPALLTRHMALALIAAFYGALLANVVFIPVANKLKELSGQEQLCMRLVIEGVLAIQAGENPKQIQVRLLTFLPPRMRGSDDFRADQGDPAD